ncbi:uncharacterized protein CCOS01_10802 [Colletotrichum costaricense]|uniref:Uncharacterized protein n=1 Tax=Colletotrichum costaricense TaxID=1209916 RepID=A0AAJ0DY70_9PEZI|nr:uncharacterized protein CCOS01_10802 [Colletotrichum costaricense]KAK1520683.1 hypothetical protein CCOS01_10802 [Colletotrichum costaricense]
MREGAADDIHMSVRYARFLDILLDASLYSSSRVHSPSGADQEGFVHQGLGTTIIPQNPALLNKPTLLAYWKANRLDSGFFNIQSSIEWLRIAKLLPLDEAALGIGPKYFTDLVTRN